MHAMPSLSPYQQLCRRLDLRGEVAHDRNWSAAADFLELIVGHALSAAPACIVECSSGTTTVMLARCCAINGRGRVYSLENGGEFAAATRAELARHGLGDYATVIDAPLADWTIAAESYRWYALDGLPDLAIDMLVIDGPPGFIQRHSRYPAVPLLHSRLAEAAAIYLDDAARPDERECVARWQAEYTDLAHDYIATERGCSILRR